VDELRIVANNLITDYEDRAFYAITNGVVGTKVQTARGVDYIDQRTSMGIALKAINNLASLIRDENIKLSDIADKSHDGFIVFPKIDGPITKGSSFGGAPYYYEGPTGYRVPLWYDEMAERWFTQLPGERTTKAAAEYWLKAERVRQALNGLNLSPPTPSSPTTTPYR